MAEALRDNKGKPKLSYFMRSFPRMVEAIARVKEMGGIKYEEGNWKKGNKPDEEYWDSLCRHLNYMILGEDYDEDTGCLHIAHAVWNLCALHELNSTLPAIDEELFAERAAHWRKVRLDREAKAEREAKDAKEKAEEEARLEAALSAVFGDKKVCEVNTIMTPVEVAEHSEPSLRCQGFCPDCTADCKEECMGEAAIDGLPTEADLPEETKRHIAFKIMDGERSELFAEMQRKITDQHMRDVVEADRRQREADEQKAAEYEDAQARKLIEEHIQRIRDAHAAEEES
jgi:hypothetical protein